MPDISGVELDDVQGLALESAASVWVPNRNGLFINIAAVYAENLGQPSSIITGFNSEEAATFTDNSVDFIFSINQSLKYSTMQETTVVSPTSELNKTDIVSEGLRLDIPWDYIWSCYSDQSQLCGVCESCRRFKRALLNNEKHELTNKLFNKLFTDVL